MGAYKGGDARYAVVSARVSDRELDGLMRFAGERGLNVTAAVRLLLNVGLDFMNRGDGNAK